MSSLNFKRGSLEETYTPRSFTDFFDFHMVLDVKGRGAFQVYRRGYGGITFLTLHAAGLSGLSFALLARELENIIDCTILSIDLRHHGNSYADDNDWSVISFAKDVQNALDLLYSGDVPDIHVIGHALGGHVALELAHLMRQVSSLMLINAIEAQMRIPSLMTDVGTKLPTHFESIEEAILFYLQMNETTNASAARVVVPGLLINLTSNEYAANEVASCVKSKSSLTAISKDHIKLLLEKNLVSEVLNSPTSQISFFGGYTWRFDVGASMPFWDNWNKGLDNKFLNFQGPKEVLLTSVHDLDASLNKAKMQGKFQCDIIPASGTNIHESKPAEVADVLATFLEKQKIASRKQKLGNRKSNMFL